MIMSENFITSTNMEFDLTDVENSREMNSPLCDNFNQSNKSKNSIEDLNKEIERLFIQNDQFEFPSFIWDTEQEIAEGRRAPVADILLSYKNYSSHHRKKKRRSATALGIRNYNESDSSSNSISSPDDTLSYQKLSKNKQFQKFETPLIVPIPIDQSRMKLNTINFNKPFSVNKLQLSEDSAFAPIKSVSRLQSVSSKNNFNF